VAVCRDWPHLAGVDAPFLIIHRHHVVVVAVSDCVGYSCAYKIRSAIGENTACVGSANHAARRILHGMDWHYGRACRESRHCAVAGLAPERLGLCDATDQRRSTDGQYTDILGCVVMTCYPKAATPPAATNLYRSASSDMSLSMAQRLGEMLCRTCQDIIC
jgi:hypothetical protein